MLNFQRTVFILLLASLQWTRCNASTTSPISSLKTTASISAYKNESSTTTGTSIMSVVTSPIVTQHTETSTITDYGTQSSSTTLLDTRLNQTSQQLNHARRDTTQSFTSENRMSSSSEIPTTTSNMLIISESYANTKYSKPSEATSNSSTTANYNSNFTTMVSTNDAQTTNVTAPPNNTTSAISLTTSNNAKTVLRTSVQTTRLHPIFTKSSAETHEPRKDYYNNGGVIFGAIVGAVLGSALIGLVGYFMCRKRKSDGFVHQRLYDDTPCDPVLRLDNAPESYGESFADRSYYSPNETTAQNHNTPPYDAIQMDDMTLSPHLP